MTLFHLAFRHLCSLHPRSLATLAGITLAVASLVSLVGLARGIAWTLETSLETRQADAVVTEARAFDLASSILPAALSTDLEANPEVEAAMPELWRLTSLPDGRSVAVVGWPVDGFAWDGLEFLDGARPLASQAGSAILGTDLAERAGLVPGDRITLFQSEFNIAGTVRASAMLSRNLVYLPLPVMQELTFRDGMATSILLRLAAEDRERRRAALTRIQSAYPEHNIEATETLVREFSYGRIAETLSLSISSIALVGAALMVFNTMSMAVGERRHEFAILSAIGWARWRIVTVILLEGVVLALLAGAFGCILGAVAAQAVAESAFVDGLIAPQLTVTLFTQALALSAGIGLLGALMPALSVTARAPSDVLRGR